LAELRLRVEAELNRVTAAADAATGEGSSRATA
jgi:hypothetical protein